MATTAACGGPPAPTKEFTEAKSAVRAADEVGAKSVPEAALYLKMARDNIATAERAVNADDNDSARLYLKRAQADAELSIALAKESAAREKAETAMRKVEAVRADIAAEEK
ncbi:MAG TPA: DUF4398 domain-containing protein [Kofleriaceae bacterium]|nr:DUF4398 domain-containing protein [Kofleriaceae bacterium]